MERPWICNTFTLQIIIEKHSKSNLETHIVIIDYDKYFIIFMSGKNG